MSLADYLAKNYLTADSRSEKKPKKRKRKEGPSSTNGLIIAEDDVLGWKTMVAEGSEDDGPLTVGGSSSAFRKSNTSTWQTIGPPAPTSSEQAAADAIIATAAAESAARNLADEEAPAVDDTNMMASGAHAGLQTADQVSAQLARKQAAERFRFEQEGSARSGKGQETIYRDATGRIINVAMKRAEARKKAEEEAAKAAAELEAQKGDVQRAQREKRKAELADAKFMPVARFVDDVEMNDELKAKEVWNDPAAQFLMKSRGGRSVSGKPLYQGPAEPNRYGIRPGHRWDGVDRGNGFEKQYFAARNRRADLKNLDYAWQMDE